MARKLGYADVQLFSPRVLFTTSLARPGTSASLNDSHLQRVQLHRKIDVQTTDRMTSNWSLVAARKLLQLLLLVVAIQVVVVMLAMTHRHVVVIKQRLSRRLYLSLTLQNPKCHPQRPHKKLRLYCHSTAVLQVWRLLASCCLASKGLRVNFRTDCCFRI